MASSFERTPCCNLECYRDAVHSIEVIEDGEVLATVEACPVHLFDGIGLVGEWLDHFRFESAKLRLILDPLDLPAPVNTTGEEPLSLREDTHALLNDDDNPRLF